MMATTSRVPEWSVTVPSPGGQTTQTPANTQHPPLFDRTTTILHITGPPPPGVSGRLRNITVHRGDTGFGFTLRHFIVYPPPESRVANHGQELRGSDAVVGWGFEPMDTIFIKHVKAGGPAQQAGLSAGDRIVSVNGESIAGKSYPQVIQIIQKSGNLLNLLVVPKEDDILQLFFPKTAYQAQTGMEKSLSPRTSVVSKSHVTHTRSSPPMSASQPPPPYPAPPVSCSRVPPLATDGRSHWQPNYPQIKTSTKLTSCSKGCNTFPAPPDLKHRSNWSLSSSSAGSSSGSSRGAVVGSIRETEPWPREPSPYDSSTWSLGSVDSSVPPIPGYRPSSKFLPTSVPGSLMNISYVTGSHLSTAPYHSRIPENSGYSSGPPSNVWTADINRSLPGSGDSGIGSIGDQQLSLNSLKPYPPTDWTVCYPPPMGAPESSLVVKELETAPVIEHLSQEVALERLGLSPSAAAIHTSIVNRLRSSFEKKEEFLLRPVVKPPPLPPPPPVSAFTSSPTRKRTALPPAYENGLSKENGMVVAHAQPIISRQATHHSEKDSLLNYENVGRAINGFSEKSKHESLSETKPLVFAPPLRKASSLDSDISPSRRYRRPTPENDIMISGLHLVSHRAKLFESGSLEAEAAYRTSLYHNELSRISGRGETPTVSMMAAQFENLSASQETFASSLDSEFGSGSLVTRINRNRPTTTPAETRNKVIEGKSVPPSEVPSKSANVLSSGCDYKPKNETIVTIEDDDSYDDGRDRKPMRQNSYLSAVVSPYHRDPRSNDIDPKIVLRDHTNTIYDEARIRRVSYMKATASDSTEMIDVDGNEESAKIHSKQVPGIHKLKALFTDKGSVAENAEKEQASKAEGVSPTQEVTREGWLGCKVSAVDGKRAHDRSWRQVFATLRGHFLGLYKEKKDARECVPGAEEHMINVQNTTADVAANYTKKKHVFRITTDTSSEYLMQAENQADMHKWLHVIQESGAGNSENEQRTLVSRRAAMFEQISSRLSPQLGGNRLAPGEGQGAGRTRSPSGHSPTPKTRKPLVAGDEKTKTWRGRMARTIRRIHGTHSSSSGPTSMENASIGVPLEECYPSPNNEFVPRIVEVCTSVVESRGLEVVGIYRVPGNTTAVSALSEVVNRGMDSPNLQDPKWMDINVVSSLLKAFFRKLPDPIVTSELYPLFIQANKLTDSVQRMCALKKLIQQLPDHNYETLKFLFRHLQRVVQHSHINKMASRNLAIVFGPTLIRAADDNMVTMVTDMSHQCRIVEGLITHCDWFFNDEDDSGDADLSEVFLTQGDNFDASCIPGHQVLLNNAQKMEHNLASRKVKTKILRKYITSAEEATTASVSSDSAAYEERDIDTEIQLRQHRSESGLVDLERKPSTTLTVPKSVAESIPPIKDPLPCNPEPENPSSGNRVTGWLTAPPRPTPEEEIVLRRSSLGNRTVLTGTDNSRRSSLGSSEGKRLTVIREPQPYPHMGVSGLLNNLQERVRQFEEETKALLERDIHRQRENKLLHNQRRNNAFQEPVLTYYYSEGGRKHRNGIVEKAEEVEKKEEVVSSPVRPTRRRRAGRSTELGGMRRGVSMENMALRSQDELRTMDEEPIEETGTPETKISPPRQIARSHSHAENPTGKTHWFGSLDSLRDAYRNPPSSQTPNQGHRRTHSHSQPQRKQYCEDPPVRQTQPEKTNEAATPIKSSPSKCVRVRDRKAASLKKRTLKALANNEDRTTTEKGKRSSSGVLRSLKRRHTIGGSIRECEKFRSLLATVNAEKQQKEEENKAASGSAWERLQPAVKNNSLANERSLASWIKQERLRASTPDLSRKSSSFSLFRDDESDELSSSTSERTFESQSTNGQQRKNKRYKSSAGANLESHV